MGGGAGQHEPFGLHTHSSSKRYGTMKPGLPLTPTSYWVQ